MALTEQHWLDESFVSPSGWRYICGCGQEFHDSDRQRAHTRFMTHLEEARRDTRTG